ncbi:hypothetical protein NEUTE1DRAFT_107001 [Neurospora tetrasperma FGSC 2508]|uniref:Uncharacterized protein n=1 Tax=Neurospora tetrasperma (strain FGSC 2508 / ATCC MYA-4615 / P0657) TaxID=510951 RepID=F8MC10_NEUT8|nr:uncharacterized protein NEUTE1DRAFT_107001 [Neurospora tetrasperma FGSC 2508]EGO60364.1 hypothetical protein NEUTE1DRAFT_107001 [Neurospora tetrasperma FGSC 2508]
MRCGLPVAVVAAVQVNKGHCSEQGHREKGSRTRNGIFHSFNDFLCIPSVIKGAFKTWGRWFLQSSPSGSDDGPLWCLVLLYQQGQDRFDGTRPVPVAAQSQSQSRPVDLTEEGPAGQDMVVVDNRGSLLSRPSHARRLASNSHPGGQRMAAVSVGDKHVQSSISRATGGSSVRSNGDRSASDKSAVLPPSPARWTTNPTM